jgi:hypothetical protein
MPERTSELWNCSGVMPLTRLAIEAVNSAVVSCFALDETLAVPTIWSTCQTARMFCWLRTQIWMCASS